MGVRKVESEVLGVEEGHDGHVGLVGEGTSPEDVEETRSVGVAGLVGSGRERSRREGRREGEFGSRRSGDGFGSLEVDLLSVGAVRDTEDEVSSLVCFDLGDLEVGRRGSLVEDVGPRRKISSTNPTAVVETSTDSKNLQAISNELMREEEEGRRSERELGRKTRSDLIRFPLDSSFMISGSSFAAPPDLQELQSIHLEPYRSPGHFVRSTILFARRPKKGRKRRLTSPFEKSQ